MAWAGWKARGGEGGILMGRYGTKYVRFGLCVCVCAFGKGGFGKYGRRGGGVTCFETRFGGHVAVGVGVEGGGGEKDRMGLR